MSDEQDALRHSESEYTEPLTFGIIIYNDVKRSVKEETGGKEDDSGKVRSEEVNINICFSKELNDMKTHEFTPQGVCSQKIEFSIDDGKLHNVHFTAGCPGNLQAIGKLVEGRDANEVAYQRTKSVAEGDDCCDYPSISFAIMWMAGFLHNQVSLETDKK